MAEIKGRTLKQIAAEEGPGIFTVGAWDVEELRDALPAGAVKIHPKEPRQIQIPVPTPDQPATN